MDSSWDTIVQHYKFNKVKKGNEVFWTPNALVLVTPFWLCAKSVRFHWLETSNGVTCPAKGVSILKCSNTKKLEKVASQLNTHDLFLTDSWLPGQGVSIGWLWTPGPERSWSHWKNVRPLPHKSDVPKQNIWNTLSQHRCSLEEMPVSNMWHNYLTVARRAREDTDWLQGERPSKTGAWLWDRKSKITKNSPPRGNRDVHVIIHHALAVQALKHQNNYKHLEGVIRQRRAYNIQKMELYKMLVIFYVYCTPWCL